METGHIAAELGTGLALGWVVVNRFGAVIPDNWKAGVAFVVGGSGAIAVGLLSGLDWRTVVVLAIAAAVAPSGVHEAVKRTARALR